VLEAHANGDFRSFNIRIDDQSVIWRLEYRSGPEKLSKLLAYLGEAGSASEAERVMKQGGFEVNGSLVKDPAYK